MQAKEQDLYDTKKVALEKELSEKQESVEKDLAERQKNLIAQEQEVAKLREEVSQFPQKLAEEIFKAREDTQSKVRSELQFQMELSSKEMEGERKLYEQKVVSLDAKIKELEALVASLNRRVDEAGKQTQGIALKAIEGASSRFPYKCDTSYPKSQQESER